MSGDEVSFDGHSAHLKSPYVQMHPSVYNTLQYNFALSEKHR